MKSLKLLALVGVLVLTACTDENSSDVWNAAESSSSVENIVRSSSSVADALSSSSAENAAESSSSVAGGAESSSSEIGAESSSSAVADTVWHQANLTWYTSWPEPDSEE